MISAPGESDEPAFRVAGCKITLTRYKIDSVTIERELHERIRECLARDYGLEGGLQRLPGENLNFLLTSGADRRYVLKIVGPDMPAEVVELDCAAIEHALAREIPIALPRTIENLYGSIETRIGMHINTPYRARLMCFLEGKLLSQTYDISEDLLCSSGEAVALIDEALRDFDHPAAYRDHRWNLVTAGQHEGVVRTFSDPGRQSLLAWAFRGWRAARDRLRNLPWQIIHGDPHDENMLVEGDRVSGLIDFGDCGHNPVICDLAICLAYLMMRGSDPLSIAAAVIDGYRRARAVSAAELKALYPLICARLAVSLCVAQERKALDPSNPNWFGSEQAAWALLERLRGIGQVGFARCLR